MRIRVCCDEQHLVQISVEIVEIPHLQDTKEMVLIVQQVCEDSMPVSEQNLLSSRVQHRT